MSLFNSFRRKSVPDSDGVQDLSKNAAISRARRSTLPSSLRKRLSATFDIGKDTGRDEISVFVSAPTSIAIEAHHYPSYDPENPYHNPNTAYEAPTSEPADNHSSSPSVSRLSSLRRRSASRSRSPSPKRQASFLGSKIQAVAQFVKAPAAFFYKDFEGKNNHDDEQSERDLFETQTTRKDLHSKKSVRFDASCFESKQNDVRSSPIAVTGATPPTLPPLSLERSRLISDDTEMDLGLTARPPSTMIMIPKEFGMDVIRPVYMTLTERMILPACPTAPLPSEEVASNHSTSKASLHIVPSSREVEKSYEGEHPGSGNPTEKIASGCQFPEESPKLFLGTDLPLRLKAETPDQCIKHDLSESPASEMNVDAVGDTVSTLSHNQSQLQCSPAMKHHTSPLRKDTYLDEGDIHGDQGDNSSDGTSELQYYWADRQTCEQIREKFKTPSSQRDVSSSIVETEGECASILPTLEHCEASFSCSDEGQELGNRYILATPVCKSLPKSECSLLGNELDPINRRLKSASGEGGGSIPDLRLSGESVIGLVQQEPAAINARKTKPSLSLVTEFLGIDISRTRTSHPITPSPTSGRTFRFKNRTSQSPSAKDQQCSEGEEPSQTESNTERLIEYPTKTAISNDANHDDYSVTQGEQREDSLSALNSPSKIPGGVFIPTTAKAQMLGNMRSSNRFAILGTLRSQSSDTTYYSSSPSNESLLANHNWSTTDLNVENRLESPVKTEGMSRDPSCQCRPCHCFDGCECEHDVSCSLRHPHLVAKENSGTERTFFDESNLSSQTRQVSQDSQPFYGSCTPSQSDLSLSELSRNTARQAALAELDRKRYLDCGSMSTRSVLTLTSDDDQFDEDESVSTGTL